MIAPEDLLSPAGPVDGSLFPGEPSNVLTVRLQKYIDNTSDDLRVAQVPVGPRRDNLTRAYALYQVFRDVYIRMSANPLTLNVTEKGGHGYSYEQIRGMKSMADKYLADFNGLLVIDPDVQSTQLPGTVSVRNRFVW